MPLSLTTALALCFVVCARARARACVCVCVCVCVCGRYKYFMAWFAAQLVRFAFVDGFTPAQVHAEFAEAAAVDALHVFGGVLPAVGFVACVLAGWCSTYSEVETTLWFGMALGLFNDAARVLSSSMGWWEAGMVVFAAYKGFVFSFLASFLLREYGCVCACVVRCCGHAGCAHSCDMFDALCHCFVFTGTAK